MERYTLQERIELIKLSSAKTVRKTREIINDFLWPKLDIIDLDNAYFQQDGASNETMVFCGKCFRTVLSLEEVITISHRDLVI